MATIKKFEDLDVWKLAAEFDKTIYNEILLKLGPENIA